MVSIILAAGVGKRMGVSAAPKCLSVVGGQTLLHRTIDSLRLAGVLDIVIVVGYEKEQVIKEARLRAHGTRIQFLVNDRYHEGAILSLYTAREFLDRPVLIMDADVLCPPSAYERLICSIHDNALLVDGSSFDTGEEQLVFGRAGRVSQITKRPDESLKRSMESYGESIGFLKLSADAAKTLSMLLDQKVNAGIVSIEHEQVYPDLFERHPVGCERVDGIPWTEIDTPDDLRRAQKEILPLWKASPCLNRQIAGWFFPVVVSLPVTPNQWTFLGLLLGLASLIFFARGGLRADWIGAALFQAFYIVDNWDGEVARRKNLSSRLGGWLDFITDGVIQVGLPIAFAFGLIRAGSSGWVWVAGVSAAVGVFLDFIATGWAKARGFGPAIFGDSARRGAQSGIGYQIRVNLTNENFSWVVLLAMVLNAKLWLLLAMSVGCQAYWIQFVSSEWKRLRTCPANPRGRA